MRGEIVEAKPVKEEPPTPAPKKIKVLLLKASTFDFEEVLERTNWDQIMEELFRRYDSWIIEPIWESYKQRYPDVEYQCMMYDDYLE